MPSGRRRVASEGGLRTHGHSQALLLRRKIALALPRLAERSEAVWSHPGLRRLYPDLLITFHGFIRASVPLMQRAAERCRDLGASDELARELGPYLEHHVTEELGHDEWLLEDLEALGVSRAEALARLPSPTVASLVGCQYYWIDHVHPVALLGYIAVLEGNPAPTERIEELVSLTGLPRQGFRTLLKHARLDPGHRDDLDRLLDRLPLDEKHASLIGLSAFTTAELFGRLFDESANAALR